MEGDARGDNCYGAGMIAPELPGWMSRWIAQTYAACVPASIRKGLHNRRFARRSASWEKIRNTPRSLVSQVAPGLHMRLYGDSLLCEMLYCGGFEPETRSFFEAFLRSGDCFLDVGANVGFYALAAARLIGRSGNVHAFEPCSQTFQRLLDNVRLNQLENLSCHQVALSHENARAELTLTRNGFDAWNSLGRPYMGEADDRETVSTITLDSFVREHGLAGRIAAIKIDVEGWEHHVLAGAEKLLGAADAPLLCIEFTEEAAQLADSSCTELYRKLEHLGYSMFSVGPRTEDIQPFPWREHFPNVNLLATKNLAAVRQRLDEAAGR